MKVLLIHDYGTPSYGAEQQMLALRDGLRLRNHDARLFAGDGCPGGDSKNLADYRCYGSASAARVVIRTFNPSAYLKLRRVLEEFRPDVVHVRMFLAQLSPFILPLIEDVPSLHQIVWYGPICPTGTKMLPDGSQCRVRAGKACWTNRCLPLASWPPSMIKLKLYKRWRSAFDLVVANNEAVRQAMVAQGINATEVVYNGAPERPARPPLSGPPTIAFAGRLVPEKGVDVLLRAFAKVRRKLPDSRLLVVGDGRASGDLHRLASELGTGSAVVLTGHLGREDMERELGQAWVQTIPSRWSEPFANVGIEAMMRGTAVVASRGGGMGEMVDHGHTGLLVSPGDVEALADVLRQLLGDRDLCERMGAAGRAVATKRFSRMACVDRFIELYGSLVRPAVRKGSASSGQHPTIEGYPTLRETPRTEPSSHLMESS